MSPSEALLGATALHTGFQLVVSVLVYPALVAVPAPDFAAGHARHSRRIVPLVVLVYGAVVVACTWVLIDGPRSPSAVLSCAASALAGGTTAFLAAPTHARLGRDGPTSALLVRLLLADRVRCAAAVVALGAAVATAGFPG